MSICTVAPALCQAAPCGHRKCRLAGPCARWHPAVRFWSVSGVACHRAFLSGAPCRPPMTISGTRGARCPSQSSRGPMRVPTRRRAAFGLGKFWVLPRAGRCPSVPWGSGCTRRTCLKIGCARLPLLRAAVASYSLGLVSRHGTAGWACAIGADETDVVPKRACASRAPWANQRLVARTCWCRGRVLLG